MCTIVYCRSMLLQQPINAIYGIFTIHRLRNIIVIHVYYQYLNTSRGIRTVLRNNDTCVSGKSRVQ